ncbi:MAG TPA: hypothetical protein VG870_04200 [Chitinophagaceae bacterium]|nr:hypothetical protein [Chitinophagaceae bacterium]
MTTNIPNPPNLERALVIIIATILIVAMAIASSGCKVIRSIKATHRDSIATARVDTGHVSRSETTGQINSDWWREIISFLPKGKDSIVYQEKTLQPVYYTQPVQIIREGGTQQQAIQTVNYDSVWNVRFNQLEKSLDEKISHTKSTGFPGWWVPAAVGVVVLTQFIFSYFKIIRK